MIAKTFFMAAALAAAQAATAGTKECVELGNFGRSVAEARDVGAPIDRLLPIVEGNSSLELVMVAVYDSTLTPDEASTALIVSCMKALRAKP